MIKPQIALRVKIKTQLKEKTLIKIKEKLKQISSQHRLYHHPSKQGTLPLNIFDTFKYIDIMSMVNINQREKRRMDLLIMHLFLLDKATKILTPP